MYKGSCLCGEVKFELADEPVAVSHCHCRMCQKQHGSAFATYARFPRQALHYVTDMEKLASYNSSADVVRKFCRTCGSSIEWGPSGRYLEWVSIAVATLDTEFKALEIEDIHVESRARWVM